jgi:hypothetical protein
MAIVTLKCGPTNSTQILEAIALHKSHYSKLSHLILTISVKLLLGIQNLGFVETLIGGLPRPRFVSS